MNDDQKRPDEDICFRCGECCRRFQVLLERAEMQRLADFLGISPDDFFSRYSDPRWPGQDKWLIRQMNSACPFLSGADREYICTVHTVKPQACREWKALYDKPECQQGLRQYWHLLLRSDALQGTPENINAFTEFLNNCRESE